MIKTLLPAVALTATAVLAAAPAQAASTTYFGGFGGLSTSHSFMTSDGVDITATATSHQPGRNIHHDSQVGQYLFGLGVTNTQKTRSLGKDSHKVDGKGWNDTVWLEFSESFSLEKVLFSYVDCNDDVRIVDQDHNVLAQINLGHQPGIWGFVNVDVSGFNIAGSKIGFTAFGSNDDWKLKGVQGHAVPTPSAAAAGVLGLAALAARRRRREEVNAG